MDIDMNESLTSVLTVWRITGKIMRTAINIKYAQF